jgi:hypothetical protein
LVPVVEITPLCATDAPAAKVMAAPEPVMARLVLSVVV